MNLADKAYNYTFDSLLKYIKEKHQEEKKKQTLRFILMI